MTYNVHSCRGSDGRLKPDRILAVIRAAKPDVVALQELDGESISQLFADSLHMRHFFVEARAKGNTGFGNALLSRLPGTLIGNGTLPRLHERTEPRAAQQVRFRTEFGEVDVVNTHLGLVDAERQLQVEHLLSDEWLRRKRSASFHVLCGDLNARPGTPAYQRLCRDLTDAQRAGRRRRATFPALFPIVRIDHVFTCSELSAARVEVPSHVTARLASDHRPVVVDLIPAAEHRPHAAHSHAQ